MRKPKKTAIGIILILFMAVFSIVAIWYYMDREQMSMEHMINLPEWNSVASSQWQTLAQKKVFFAHMSVGYNILDGARAVLDLHPDISLAIVKTSNPQEMQHPAIYHEEMGYNADPTNKVESFCSLVRQIQSANPDIVLMKFCYVDVFQNTDVKAIFDAYQKAITRLQAQMPAARFLHCTVPLKSSPRSIKIKFKETVKFILGRPTYIDANHRREQLNEMLRNTWPTGHILDIAQIESTTPEGFLCYKNLKGQKIPFLCSSYTLDGGHLNDRGAQRIGEQFLIFLANAATPSEQK